MLRIDPHTHSAQSDGTDTPTELMFAALRAGLDVLGLTDHDTTSGWEEAVASVEHTGVALLRGIEMSCAVSGITVHMLGYLFDPEDEHIVATLEKSRASRCGRAKKMVENLRSDYDITWDDVRAQAPADGGPVGRPHIADALVKAGYFRDRSAAFVDVLSPRGPYYVCQETPNPVDAVRVIREAGGVPVWAHPRARVPKDSVEEDVIAEMVEAGLFGIERDHCEHDEDDRRYLDGVAERWGLHVTGASDYHGNGKPNRLGENLTSTYVYRALEEEGRLEVIRP